MTPVDTVPGTGGCLSACLASLLGIPLSRIPIFSEDEEAEESAAWFTRLNDWLRKEQGLQAFALSLEIKRWRPVGFHIRTGPAVLNGEEHAVVYLGEEMVHDPTPPRSGLTEQHCAIVLVALDPAYWTPPAQMFLMSRDLDHSLVSPEGHDELSLK